MLNSAPINVQGAQILQKCDKVMIYTVLMFVRNECVICVSMSVERHACNICL